MLLLVIAPLEIVPVKVAAFEELKLKALVVSVKNSIVLPDTPTLFPLFVDALSSRIINAAASVDSNLAT